ncbi:formylglycine-generating enzyme family protein [Acaryochloris marina]|uniref:formylglycine-generating enzyme family protein n=1 Tax=Acaryochloris marina TaxID=155978 RepID=UPI0021C425F0|nr:formylglycine-generating enzyme family protein [Acaryochloris marina]
MVEIPGGEFIMGASGEEDGSWDRERPQHRVIIAPFLMSRFTVTQAQWEAIMESNPSQFKGANRPVENITWNEAVGFCQKLSQKSGKDYRLPSEAEWEYTCRGGTSTLFHFGETITPALANYNNASNGSKEENRQQTTEVGCFPPNGFGLYDMHGNVWELCLDTWHGSYAGAPTDGSAWIDHNPKYHVARGGSYISGPRLCRCANRGRSPIAGLIQGFRIVCAIPKSVE